MPAKKMKATAKRKTAKKVGLPQSPTFCPKKPSKKKK
jgi:hypothetical protein